MNLDNIHFDPTTKNLDAQGVPNDPSLQKKGDLEGSPKFADLLETLQRFRINGDSDRNPEAKLLEFGEALEKADEAHRTVMDLSRQLENAYKKALKEHS
jgi:hypothetical protein